jgi:GTP-binding protein Era
MTESTPHRSGYVAVVGKPNVGKSTLVNALIGHKVTIVSSKPQTTRRRVLGILTRPAAQLLFVDTPGIHRPRQALNKYMMREVDAALADCDAILFVVDVTAPPSNEDQRVAEMIVGLPRPKLLALNKADKVNPLHLVANVAAHEALLHPLRPEEDAMLTSATRGDNLGKLLALLIARLPAGPAFYPADQYTNQTERIIAAELVREQALKYLNQEVPHAVAVEIEEFQERGSGAVFIAATIFVERDTQKGILIGHGGEMLKKIGAGARKEIETELGTTCFLELWVKVRPKWRTDNRAVEQFLKTDLGLMTTDD